MFISQGIIEILLQEAIYASDYDIDRVLLKAKSKNRLSFKDISILLYIHDERHLQKLFEIAGNINKNRSEQIDVDLRITATTKENYLNLKEEGISQYMLFQETYHYNTYLKNYGKSITDDYVYHVTAFDRAIDAGIENIGTGILLGLADPKFEILALTMHNEHLEKNFGIGFSSILFPRIKIEKNTTPENIVNDTTFKKIIAITRLALPLTNIIMSTKETDKLKKDFLNFGGSQLSSDL